MIILHFHLQPQFKNGLFHILHITKPLVYNDYLPSIWLSMAWWSFSIFLLMSDNHWQMVCAEWSTIVQCAKFMPTRASTFEQNLHTNLIKHRSLTHISLYFAELRTLNDVFLSPYRLCWTFYPARLWFPTFFYTISYFNSRFVSFYLWLTPSFYCFKVISSPSWILFRPLIHDLDIVYNL